MKKYEIEYRDCTGMRCGVEVEALHEKEAIIIYQQELIENGDYMTELISIDENVCGCDDCDGEWKLEDGTELDQDSQNALNDAMGSYTNSDGVTLEEAIKRASERKNNK
tara:strand:- start:202 stop:528 length:327 start_codon:yes stop_codon:yes gene_type:complete